MGKSNIKVIPVPRKELTAWWNRLNPDNQAYIKERLGHLVDLIKVDYQPTLIKALAKFWDSKTLTFDFRGLEITPTLEEYTTIIGVKFDDHIVQPLLGKDSTIALSKFLHLKITEIEKILKSNSGKFTLSFLYNNYSSLPIEAGLKPARIFILAFFAFVLFPTSRTTFDPSIVHVAKQACYRWNYSYMILAETFLSLSRFQFTQKGTFQASNGLLYMWFTSHIKTFNLRVGCYEISQYIHPLGSFLKCQSSVEKLSFKDWVKLLGDLEPKQLRWRLTWPRILEARITGIDGNPIPLLGCTGGSAYYPIRVVRQFGMLQEVPPAVYPDNFAFDLPQGRLTKETKTLYQAKIDLIIHTLKNSPLQDVEWPDYLDEEMNVHRASKEYIKMFKEYRQSMVEPYVPDYIVPYLPGVEPYIPEDMGPPPAEENEDLHVWDLGGSEIVKDALASKRLRTA